MAKATPGREYEGGGGSAANMGSRIPTRSAIQSQNRAAGSYKTGILPKDPAKVEQGKAAMETVRQKAVAKAAPKITSAGIAAGAAGQKIVDKTNTVIAAAHKKQRDAGEKNNSVPVVKRDSKRGD